MLDTISLPIICAANLSFALIKVLKHPLLQEEEKLLWIWLATFCADNAFCCSLTYEQISYEMNKPLKNIHRSLFRLTLMGFLQGNIPIWYGVPTKEMIKEMRHLKLTLPPEQNNVFVLPKHVNKPVFNFRYGKYPLKPRKVKKSLFQKFIRIIEAYPFTRKNIRKALFNF